MKKRIFIALAILMGCSVSTHVWAQHSGFYISTGDAFMATGLEFDKDNSGDYYGISQYDTFVSLGLGFRSKGGLGFEVDALAELAWLKGLREPLRDEDYRDFAKALCVTMYYSWPVASDLTMLSKISYRYMESSQYEFKGSFHDILIEPLVIEYRRRESHWGFGLSLVSLEGLSMIDEDGPDKNHSSFGISGTGFGLIINKFPIRVSYYF